MIDSFPLVFSISLNLYKWTTSLKIKKSHFAHMLGIALLGLGVLIASGYVLEKNTRLFSASYQWTKERTLALVSSNAPVDAPISSAPNVEVQGK